jgi:hypothetical protein
MATDPEFDKSMIVEQITDTITNGPSGVSKKKSVKLTSDEVSVTLSGDPDTMKSFIKGTDVNVVITIAQKKLGN